MDDTKQDTPAPAEASSNIPVPLKEDDDATAIEHETPAKQSNAAPAEPSSTTIASSLQSFTDKALNFLSHASNETLGACLVGLGATTYMVLGRVGLVIVGVAGGVVLHATWEGIRGDTRDEATKQAELDRRREVGVEVAKRLLDLRASSRSQQGAADLKVYANQALNYSAFEPETATALNTFTTAVIKDYVHYWYDATIPGEESFPTACRQTFTAFILSLSSHLQRKRPADAFLDFLTHASSILIVFLTELSAALNASPNSSPQEAIRTYMELKPDTSLAYMLDQPEQTRKLAEISEDILEAYLDPKSYNCPPVHAFLKEVLAQLVLGYTVQYCSQPHWINDWIVYGLEESETTKEVMDIVDAGVEGREKVDTPKVEEQIREKQEGKSRKESNANASAHRRKMSRAEEAMDEAMKEAQRLTQMMIEDDERRAREGRDREATPPNAGDSSDATTQGAPTPTSSQSDRDRQTDDNTSISEAASPVDERPSTPNTQFTNFDQLVPNAQPTALGETASPGKPMPKPAVLTLHNATISIFDDSVPGERASIKAKPTTDYLIQIEPSSSAFPGWMIARKYADFEILHEVLRRISVITGVRFTEAHAELPKWKTQTKASLRTELERYLTDAVRFQPLAESEGMKRFLEKDQGLNKSPSGSTKGFGWPTPDAFGKLGGDMMNVLTKAPKQVAGGVAGGGKAVFGGVAGLVGAGKKSNSSQANLSRSTTNTSFDGAAHQSRPSMSVNRDSYLGSLDGARQSQDSLRVQDRRASTFSVASGESSRSPKPVPTATPSRPESVISQPELGLTVETSPEASVAELPPKEASIGQNINLPPPPSEMPEDYDSPISPTRKSTDTRSTGLDQRFSQSTDIDGSVPALPARPQKTSKKPESKPKEPLSERETSNAVELIFAVITQLYTLSGAWQIRRTLLSAAKTFLLRPGNPQLMTIRDLLQTSLLDANFSDSGMAHQIHKLRENTLPTAEEMEAWKRDFPEKTAEQKEELRIKARQLLITKGMPQALTSVMGAAASGEALGKVFDCLQIPEVSRGLIFGLMLQALRVVTH